MNKNPGPGKRWVKGQSGNPKGGPKKGDSWRSIFSDYLDIKDVYLPDGTAISRKEAIAMRIIKSALAGDISAANFIGKYSEPADPLKVQHIDEEGKPVHAKVFTIKKMTLDEWQAKYKGRSENKEDDRPSIYRPDKTSK